MAVYKLNNKLPFPSAVGWGSQWSFPSNYEVYVVTSLANSGVGTLRDALTSTITSNGRIVVFNGLSGTISLSSEIRYIQSGKAIWVAGQTSDNGIFVRRTDTMSDNALIRIYGTSTLGASIQANAIFQNLTFAYGIRSSDFVGDAFNIHSAHNVIIDRCTFMWGPDETLSTYQATYCTIQNCMIVEAFRDFVTNERGMGSLWTARSNKVSFYRNLFGLNRQRNPLWGGSTQLSGVKHGPLGEVEFVQNVIYGWGTAGWHMASGTVEADVTYYDQFPSLINNTSIRANANSGDRFAYCVGEPGKVGGVNAFGDVQMYIKDNWDSDDRTSAGQDQGLCIGQGANCNSGVADPSNLTSTPHGYPLDYVANSTLSATGVRDAVLAKVGDQNDPDGITTEFVNAVLTLTGTQDVNEPIDTIHGAYPIITAGSTFVDATGIPASFKATHGITSATQIKNAWDIDGNAIINNAGYTALEIYLFSLTGDLIFQEYLPELPYARIEVGKVLGRGLELGTGTPGKFYAGSTRTLRAKLG